MLMRRTITLVAVMSALALIASACGAEDSSGDSAAPDTAPATEPEDDDAADEAGQDDDSDGGGEDDVDGEAGQDLDEPVSVRVGRTPGSSMSFAPYFLADALDLFTEFGLDIEEVETASDVRIAAMMADEMDFAILGATTVMDAIEQGAPIEFVGGQVVPMLTLGINAGVAAELAEQGITEQSDIGERLAALEGRILAGPPEGSAARVVLEYSLQLHGVDRGSIDLIPADQTALVSQLREGTYDAGFWGVGPVEQNLADGSAELWVSWSRGDVPEVAEMLNSGVTARVGYADENTAVLEAFRDATARGIELAREDPDGVGEILRETHFPDLDEEAWVVSWEAALEAMIPGTISRDGFESAKASLEAVRGSDFLNLDYDTHVHELARLAEDG